MKDLGTPKEVIAKWKEGKITWRTFSSEYERSLKGKEATLKELADESAQGYDYTPLHRKRCELHPSISSKAAIEKQPAVRVA